MNGNTHELAVITAASTDRLGESMLGPAIQIRKGMSPTVACQLSVLNLMQSYNLKGLQKHFKQITTSKIRSSL